MNHKIKKNQGWCFETHLGDMINALDGDFISIFTDKKYIPEDSIPVLQDKESKEYTAVPQVSPATCGISGMISDNKIHGYKYFSNDFLKSFKDPLLTVVQGDSMEPALQEGDLILCDRNPKKRLKPNSLDFYLINLPETGEEVATSVKRIKLSDKYLIVIPQNPEYDVMEVNIKGRSLPDVIFGRVVWVGRQLVDTSTKYTAVKILKELKKESKKK